MLLACEIPLKNGCDAPWKEVLIGIENNAVFIFFFGPAEGGLTNVVSVFVLLFITICHRLLWQRIKKLSGGEYDSGKRLGVPMLRACFIGLVSSIE